jgi:hypothetical protein
MPVESKVRSPQGDDRQEGLVERWPVWVTPSTIALGVLNIVLALGVGLLCYWGLSKTLRKKVALALSETLRDEVAAAFKAVKEGLAQESREGKETLASLRKVLPDPSGQFVGKPGALLTKGDLKTEIDGLIRAISSQPKPSPTLGAEAQNAATQLEQFGERAAKISGVLGSIEQRLGRYDVIVAGVEKAGQQMVQTVSVFQTLMGDTAKVLGSLRTDMAGAASEVSGKAAKLEKLLDAAIEVKAQAEGERQAAARVKAEAEAERRAGAADRQAAESARAEAAASRDQASRRRQEAADELKTLEGKRADLALVQANADRAIAKQAALEQESQRALADAMRTKGEAEASLQAVASEREAARAAREETAGMLRQAQGFIDSLWPEGFRDGGPLVEMRRGIEGRLAEDNPEAGVLLAALSGYRWVLASASSQDVPKALSEVSRCAYRYWKTCGLTATQSDDEAKKLAGVLSAQVEPHFSVRVASPKSQKEPTWMIYGTQGQVAEAETWSVLNNKGIAVERAKVV